MFFLKKKNWPQLGTDEIKKRSRILVIDDREFYYLKLFIKDGYTIDKWDDVTDINKLENGYYDIILLDIQGVGNDYSKEEGLGILKHIRKANPTQIVIAYSDADWSLKYKGFFDLADSTLEKAADYIVFKSTVDKLLTEKFSIGFYIDRAIKALGHNIPDNAKATKLITEAITTRSDIKLRKYLDSNVDAKDIINIVLQIVQIAIGIAAI